jgi:uncharacterized protein DUF1501
MVGDGVDHGAVLLQLHISVFSFERPSMGAWILCGLGSENQDLPGFITIKPSVQKSLVAASQRARAALWLIVRPTDDLLVSKGGRCRSSTTHDLAHQILPTLFVSRRSQLNSTEPLHKTRLGPLQTANDSRL